MNANLRNFALWVIIVLLLLALFTLFQNPGQRASSQDISFSQLLSEVDQNHVRDVVIQGPETYSPSVVSVRPLSPCSGTTKVFPDASSSSAPRPDQRCACISTPSAL